MPYLCEFCNKQFASKFSRQRHEYKQHSCDDEEISEGSGYNTDTEIDTDTEMSSEDESDGQESLKTDAVVLKLRKKAASKHLQEVDEIDEQLGDIPVKEKVKRVRKVIIPKVRKSLRRLVTKEILKHEQLRKSKIFKIVMETARDLIAKGYGREEAIKRAVQKRKYLINGLVGCQASDSSSTDDSDTDSEVDQSEEDRQEDDEGTYS